MLSDGEFICLASRKNPPRPTVASLMTAETQPDLQQGGGGGAAGTGGGRRTSSPQASVAGVPGSNCGSESHRFLV